MLILCRLIDVAGHNRNYFPFSKQLARLQKLPRPLHNFNIDTGVVDSLKALDLERPIIEADSCNATNSRLFDYLVRA
jgi:hypothetical protein